MFCYSMKINISLFFFVGHPKFKHLFLFFSGLEYLLQIEQCAIYYLALASNYGLLYFGYNP